MKTYWRTTKEGISYTISLQGSRVELMRGTGDKEAWGGNSVPLARFLRSQKYKQHIEATFGASVLSEVLAAVEESQQ